MAGQAKVRKGKGKADGANGGSKGEKRKKKVAPKRGVKKNFEQEEIQQLEARIKAEVPLRGGNFESSGGAKTTPEKENGPGLTNKLFADLPISKKTKDGLKASDFKKMTEIQRQAIPRALAGRDILGEARTGSGKTLAFLVPLIELLYRQNWTQMDGLGGLIISPTRELAYQIFQVLSDMGQEHEISAGCVVGGRSMAEEQASVDQMMVLVATPGRLLQHLDESPNFNVQGLQMLVLDEADRILDFGFQDTLNHIFGHLPSSRQTLLFSATLRASVQRLGRAALRSPEVVSVHADASNRCPEKLRQVCMTVSLEQKIDHLFSFLRTHSQKKMIVFVSSCKQVRFIYEAFKRLKPGPSMMELHGKQSLTKRLVVFKEFTEKDNTVALVCTDIAARGVDFPAVDWVIQMDCPDTVDSYIHRVGRTARYNASGHSALMLLPSEKAFLEKLAAARITVKSINVKQSKLLTVSGKMGGVLAGDAAIKHLAQKAYISYIRSLRLMKDKEVFSTEGLDLEAFAQSFGLVDPPALGDAGGEADLDKNPLKKRKNQSALQRLREKIKKKKDSGEADEIAAASGAIEGGGAEAVTDSDVEEQEELEAGGRKLSKWERRQKRIQRLGAEEAAKAAAPEQTVEDKDDLLELVETQREIKAPALTHAKKTKLKMRRDGHDAGATGKHTFFTGSNATAAGELAALAEEMKGQSFQDATSGGGRKAFLDSISKDLVKRDKSDAAASRARVYERHQKEKRRARAERDASGSSDDDAGVQLAGGSDSEGEAGGFVCTLGGGDDASRSPSPAPRARAAAKAGKRKRTPGPKPGDVDPVVEEDKGGEDPLAALERQALGKLGGGLFS